jgi:hypothetical protein
MMDARLGEADPAVSASTKAAGSAGSPFRHPTFALLWTATLVANIGTWMYNAAAGWLMRRHPKWRAE